jgi:hypothetical protein
MAAGSTMALRSGGRSLVRNHDDEVIVSSSIAPGSITVTGYKKGPLDSKQIYSLWITCYHSLSEGVGDDGRYVAKGA